MINPIIIHSDLDRMNLAVSCHCHVLRNGRETTINRVDSYEIGSYSTQTALTESYLPQYKHIPYSFKVCVISLCLSETIEFCVWNCYQEAAVLLLLKSHNILPGCVSCL